MKLRQQIDVVAIINIRLESTVVKENVRGGARRG